jgi:hypothetical protein
MQREEPLVLASQTIGLRQLFDLRAVISQTAARA